MINKESIDKLVECSVGIELINHDFYRGTLKKVNDNAIILEFFNGKRIVISLESIMFVKVL